MATIDTILNIRVEGTDSMVKLKASIDTTTAELKKLKAEGKSAGESQDKFNAKIVTAETKLKGLRGELNKGKNDLLKNAKAAGDTSKSYDSLTKQNAKLSAQARKLSDPLGKNSKEFSALTQKINTNTNALKKMDAQMGRQNRNVGNYKEAITGVASAVGIAIIAFKTFQRVIGTFVEFEFQMAQVGAISGATEVQLEMLTNTAKELGATTAFTAGEVAGLQKELAKLGFSPEEIEGMTAATLDLAYAFGNDLAETGEVVGVVLNSYGLEATEATRVTDVLASAFSKSALDLQKFNTAFPKVGTISSQLGFSLEGTTAILGKLSDAGLDASTAGTSLKSVFLKLADSNSALSQKLGGNVKSIDTLLPALQQLFEDGTDVEEMLGLTDKRAVTAFATMVKGADDIAALTTEFQNAEGTAKGFADVMRDTLQGSFDGMSSAADGFIITLVEAMAPAIRLVVDGVAFLFTGLSGLVKVFKFIAPAMIAYGATMVGISIAQGTFVSSLVASKVGLFLYNTGVKIAALGTRIFTAALNANPIGLIVSGLVLAGTAMFSFGASAQEAAEGVGDLTDATDKQTDSQKALEGIRNKNAKQQTGEISKLKALTESIKNATLSIEERERALKEYNKLAGTNISNLQDEKAIIDQIEKSYDNAVDAIKRKIVLQSTEEEVTELISQQLELEKELVDSQEKLEKAEAKRDASAEIYAKSNARRAELGLDSLEDLQKELKGVFREMTPEGTLDYSTPIDNKIAEQDRLLESELQYYNVVNDARGDAESARDRETEANELLRKTTIKNNKIQDQITKIYARQANVLEGLNTSTNKQSFSTGKLKTKYQKLGEAVKVAEDELKKQVVTGQQALDAFTEKADAEKMSVEDRAKGIEKIETETAAKVKKATDDLIKTKKDLKVVDDAINKQYDLIKKTIGDNVDAMEEMRKKAQDNIDLDKKQLAVLTELEDAGANLAKERISLALKVAKAELDLALKTAEASDISTDAQVANIKRLQGEISGFQNDLNSMGDDGGTSGFLNRVLYGSSEDGTAFTGADLLRAIDMTLSQVSDIMGGFNDLQNERLNTRLGIIERNQSDEIAAFENSAAAQVMTTEERDEKIEEITARHDQQMLTLKIAQFKKDQNLAIADAFISGGQSIMGILGGEGTGNVIADAIIKGILITASVAMTALQIATIKAQAPPTAEFGGIMNDSFFAKGGMVNGKSHSQGGEKFAVGGRVVELEGGEAVINKKSTAMFKPILSNINVAGGGRKFADGGMVFGTDGESNDSSILDALINQLNSQQVLLVEADVTRSQRNVKNIESRISF